MIAKEQIEELVRLYDQFHGAFNPLLPEVLEAPIVLVVEGEKDVETLREHGFVATTNAGGAKAPWLPEFTETLRGREVILLPDADEPGRRRVLAIARSLLDNAVKIVILELEGDAAHARTKQQAAGELFATAAHQGADGRTAAPATTRPATLFRSGPRHSRYAHRPNKLGGKL